MKKNNQVKQVKVATWAELQDFNPDNFVDKKIDLNYPKKDYHRIYFGEILAILQK